MKSYKLNAETKENSNNLTAKERVEQFRNQFFKNITNINFNEDPYEDKQEKVKV